MLDLWSRRSVATLYEFMIIIDVPKALTWMISESAQIIRWKRRIRVSIHHGLYSCPHFANVSHSSVLGIERRLPIKGYFLGPGGRFRPWRRWPFIQYTTKTVRVLRTKASWVSVICGRVLNWEFRMIISHIIPRYPTNSSKCRLAKRNSV